MKIIIITIIIIITNMYILTNGKLYKVINRQVNVWQMAIQLKNRSNVIKIVFFLSIFKHGKPKCMT